MTERILIIGEAASGKSMLSAYIAAQMGAGYVKFIGESAEAFDNRLTAAKLNAGIGKPPVSIKVADDFPHARDYVGIDTTDIHSLITFLDAVQISEFRAFILVMPKAITVRGHTALMASMDTILEVSRQEDGTRRVTSLKSKDEHCSRWAGDYRLGVGKIDGKSIAYFVDPRTEDDCA